MGRWKPDARGKKSTVGKYGQKQNEVMQTPASQPSIGQVRDANGRIIFGFSY